MRKDLTDLTVIVDRSGSMAQGRTQFQDSLNKMLEEQKAGDGECLLTLIQFDTVVDTIHNGIPIKDFQSYSLEPRGSTALYDAVGNATNSTGKRLAEMKEEDRPGLVLFAILTDGEENSSREITGRVLSDMIKHQQEYYSWKFVFLGADINAENAASQIGIEVNTSASYAKAKTAMAVGLTSDKILRARTATTQGLKADMSYSANEKAQLSE